MTRTHRRTAAALLVAAGGTWGWAQDPAPARPAARMLAPVAVAPDPAVVSRAAAPEAGTFGDTKPPARVAPDPRAWSGGLPAGAPRSQPAAAKPPAPPPKPPAGVPPFATGQGGVYAGPPAYRWYGYGTTTPGANPLAPTGQYPKGSANWYAQTGATPGAFPVPVGVGGEPLGRYEPPAYANPAPITAEPPTLPPPRPEPVLTRIPAPEPPRATPVNIVPPPAGPVSLLPPPRPTAAEPAAIAVSGPAPAPEPVLPPVAAVAKPPELQAPVAPPPLPASVPVGLAWQTAGGTADTLAFSPSRPAEPAAPPPQVAPLVLPPTPAPSRDEPPVVFAPSLPPPPTLSPGPPVFQPAAPAAAPTPKVTPSAADWRAARPQARGQAADAEPVSLSSLVHAACHGRARVLEVTHTGPASLSVRLAAATEADARAAAAAVSALPPLRPYAVRFRIELGGRP